MLPDMAKVRGIEALTKKIEEKVERAKALHGKQYAASPTEREEIRKQNSEHMLRGTPLPSNVVDGAAKEPALVPGEYGVVGVCYSKPPRHIQRVKVRRMLKGRPDGLDETIIELKRERVLAELDDPNSGISFFGVEFRGSIASRFADVVPIDSPDGKTRFLKTKADATTEDNLGKVAAYDCEAD